MTSHCPDLSLSWNDHTQLPDIAEPWRGQLVRPIERPRQHWLFGQWGGQGCQHWPVNLEIIKFSLSEVSKNFVKMKAFLFPFSQKMILFGKWKALYKQGTFWTLTTSKMFLLAALYFFQRSIFSTLACCFASCCFERPAGQVAQEPVPCAIK